LGAKPIYLQVEETRNTWRRLWWEMAGHVKSEYDKIKITDIFEFYSLLDMWSAQVKAERETYKQKNQQNQKHGR
jgi:hypothetical protein